jgi:hypothetical protein
MDPVKMNINLEDTTEIKCDECGSTTFHEAVMLRSISRFITGTAQDGVMPVAFLTTNDITGGNSGSPVLNDKGELIGLAFDGNWEAMTGDLVYDPNYKRTICVDIRYVLFIIEKYADAQNIMSEFILSY